MFKNSGGWFNWRLSNEAGDGTDDFTIGGGNSGANPSDLTERFKITSAGLLVFDGGAVRTDAYLSSPSNTAFGIEVFGAGNLSNAGGGDNGVRNTAIGWKSMYYNTTGYRNTAVGWQTLFDNTTGYENTAIGRAALNNNVVGNQNTAIGKSSLFNTTGSNNTALGYNSGLGILTGSNNIVIGHLADVPADGDNQLSIGNVIYGDLSAGNIGIGTTSPARRLHLLGDTVDSSTQRITGIGNSAKLELHRANGTIGTPTAVLSGNSLGGLRLGGLYSGTSYDDGVRIYANATEDWSATGHGSELVFSLARDGLASRTVRFSIKGSGKLHNKTSGLDAADTADKPQYALTVHEGIGANGVETGIGFSVFINANLGKTDAPGAAITHERTGGWSAGKLHFKTRSSTLQSGNPVTRMTIDENGNVGIGVTEPDNILVIVQSSATDPIADAWTTYSSRRWKENIQLIEGALDKVKALRGVYFDWKADGRHDMGMIAEEVGKIIPEVVAYEENGIDAQSIDYARLSAVLTEAVKELDDKGKSQQSEIDELKTQNRELKTENAELHSLIEQINARLTALESE